jgi:hypothetical protein
MCSDFQQHVKYWMKCDVSVDNVTTTENIFTTAQLWESFDESILMSQMDPSYIFNLQLF